MNEDMNEDMNDFEGQVRAMLRRRAGDIEGPMGEEPATDRRIGSLPLSYERRARRPVLPAAAVVAVIAIIGIGLVFRDDDRSVEVDSAAPTAVAEELPAWFDPTTAPVVFDTGLTEPGVAAEDYLRSRFPDFPAPDVIVADVSTDDGQATARWAALREPELRYRGEIFLRLVDGSWDVVAATTEGVHLSGLDRQGGRLVGAVTADGLDGLAVDVLGLDGEPVEDAPHPDGQPGAAYRFGTGGVSDGGAVSVDIEVGDSPVIVRAQHVGGTLLSIAEVVFPGTSAPEDQRGGCSERALDLLDPRTDVVVYLEPTVSPDAAAAVVEEMNRRPGTEVLRYLDHAQVYEQFEVLFREQPEIVAAVTPDALPPAIELAVDDSGDVSAFEARTRAIEHVRDVVSREMMAANHEAECDELGRPRATGSSVDPGG